VDGGNTKTDYLLCTEDGRFVDIYRAGSASHERFGDGYDGMERTMRGHLEIILGRNNLMPMEIAAGGFGLAGSDMPSQTAELTRRIGNMGFKKFMVANDGILGVKASESGTGVCVVNGTGTVVIGIDPGGSILQVGGVGELSGDMAGGGYARRCVMQKLYAYYYRCGPYSKIFPKLLALLDITPEGLNAAVCDFRLLFKNGKEILQITADEAQKGDKVAQSVYDEMGIHMGKSVAGCIRRLDFGETVDIILVGSIWHKINYDGMQHIFVKTVEVLTGKRVNLIPFNAPAAIGGVLWANEMLFGRINPTARQLLLDALTLERYEELVNGKIN
jgi:N-acetylglucosamine kinase-like BadF-type ATPase